MAILPRSANTTQSLQDVRLHFLNALARINIVKKPKPPVVRHQGRGLFLVRLQPWLYYFFAIVRPLVQVAAIDIANSLDLRRTIENIVNLAALLTDPSPGQSPHEHGVTDDQVNHKRLMQAILLQQFTQILRLGDGSRKTVKYATVSTIGPLDAFRDHLQNHRVRDQFAALH